MKFSSSLVFVAAVATAVVAVPKPQAEDGGHGVPPSATLSASTSSSASVSAPAPAASQPAGTGDEAGGPPDIDIPFAPSNALFTLSNNTEWTVVEAPGVFNVTAPFATKGQDKASAVFEPPQPFVAIDVWVYQRSDGGLMSMLIDGVAVARIDYYNRTAGKDDPPVKVYDGKDKPLKRAVHKVEFRNLEDARVKKFGQFNLDHVVITAAADAPQTLIQSTTPAPSVSETKTQPPLTATTTPTVGDDASSQQTPPPGNSALSLATPHMLISAVALLAAGLALF